MKIEPLRICLVSQYFPPDSGGGSTRARNLANELAREGHSVTVLTAQPHYPNGPTGIKLPGSARDEYGTLVLRTPVLPIAHKGYAGHLIAYSFFVILATVVGAAKARKIDAVWCVSPNYLSIIPGLFFRFFRGSKVVLEVVDIWPDALVSSGYFRSEFLASIIGGLCAALYKTSDSIVTLTSKMSDTIGRIRGTTAATFMVPNVIDQSIIELANRQPSRPEKFKDRLVIMYSGNLGAVYDFDVLLRTANRMLNKKRLLFVIRGSGEQGHSVEMQAKELGCSNTILMFNPVSRAEALVQTSWADVCVLPMKAGFDHSASLPLKLIEYLALGKPVIALAEGPIGDVVEKYNAGLVIKPGDAKGLADSILRLETDAPLREQFAKNASKVWQDYSAARFHEQSQKVVEQLGQRIQK